MNSLFSREYGYQYTRYEFESMKRIYEAKINRAEEMIGYITKIDDYYILRPTSTTLYPYIVCRSGEEISSNVKVYGRWIYANGLVFDIEGFEEVELGYDILNNVTSYNRYLDLLFDNSIIDDKIKEILGHILISRGEKQFRISIRDGNAEALIRRLKQFIPIEFISMNKIFIKELRTYFISKPILSFNNNSSINISYNSSDIDLRLDSMYVYDKVDEFVIYTVLKFIVSMHMINIDYKTNYNDIIDYLMDKRLDLNTINTLLSLGIANAKINRQRRLEIDNVRYVMDLLRANLMITL